MSSPTTAIHQPTGDDAVTLIVNYVPEALIDAAQLDQEDDVDDIAGSWTGDAQGAHEVVYGLVRLSWNRGLFPDAPGVTLEWHTPSDDPDYVTVESQCLSVAGDAVRVSAYGGDWDDVADWEQWPLLDDDADDDARRAWVWDRIVELRSNLVSEVTAVAKSVEIIRAGVVPCPACHGSGVVFEDHGEGRREPLGCADCQATGALPAAVVAATLVELVRAYLAEYDTPAPDAGRRAALRRRLRSAVGA